MFPSKLFRIDMKTKSIVGEASRLGTVRGAGAIFEHFKDEGFGLKMITNDGTVSKWIVKQRIELEDRLTFVLESINKPTFRMVVLEKF